MLKVLNALNAASKQYIAGLNAATQQAEDGMLAWQQNTNNNKAIQETNLQNTIRTGLRLGMLNVQQGQARKQIAEAGYGLGKNKLKLLSAIAANSAAAGQIGASVDAVASDIEMRAEEAEADIVEDSRIQELNAANEFQDILMAGQDAMQDAQNISVRKPTKPTKTKWQHIVMAEVIDAASDYATQQITLGLGPKPKEKE